MNKTFESFNSETLDISDQLQKDSHEIAFHLMGENPKLTWNDAMDIFMYNKIAEMELRIRELENNYINNT